MIDTLEVRIYDFLIFTFILFNVFTNEIYVEIPNLKTISL